MRYAYFLFRQLRIPFHHVSSICLPLQAKKPICQVERDFEKLEILFLLCLSHFVTCSQQTVTPLQCNYDMETYYNSDQLVIIVKVIVII